MVVQRLVNAERTLRIQAETLAAEKAEENERLKGELTVLQVRLCLHENDVQTGTGMCKLSVL